MRGGRGGLRRRIEETGGGLAVRGVRRIGCPLEPVGRCTALLTDVRGVTGYSVMGPRAVGASPFNQSVQLKSLVSIVPLELPLTSNDWVWLMPPQKPPLSLSVQLR